MLKLENLFNNFLESRNILIKLHLLNYKGLSIFAISVRGYPINVRESYKC